MTWSPGAFNGCWTGSPKRWAWWHIIHPPRLYTVPIGGWTMPPSYHLLGEPETTIDAWRNLSFGELLGFPDVPREKNPCKPSYPLPQPADDGRIDLFWTAGRGTTESSNICQIHEVNSSIKSPLLSLSRHRQYVSLFVPWERLLPTNAWTCHLVEHDSTNKGFLGKSSKGKIQ